MKRYVTIIIFLIVISGQVIMSQTLTGDIVASKIREKATMLNDYQNLIADKDKSPEIKRHYVSQALSLFVNNGNPFSVDTIQYQGPTITMKSTLRNRPVRRKVKDYLQGVMDLRYSAVDLTGIKIPVLPNQINESDFVKCEENLYRYTCQITRELAGYMDGTPVYRDITPYEYSVFLFMNKTIDGTEYIIYLNDIEIEEKEQITQ